MLKRHILLLKKFQNLRKLPNNKSIKGSVNVVIILECVVLIISTDQDLVLHFQILDLPLHPLDGAVLLHSLLVAVNELLVASQEGLLQNTIFLRRGELRLLLRLLLSRHLPGRFLLQNVDDHFYVVIELLKQRFDLLSVLKGKSLSQGMDIAFQLRGVLIV